MPTLQILGVTLSEKMSILCVVGTLDAIADFAENVNQLILFDLQPHSGDEFGLVCINTAYISLRR